MAMRKSKEPLESELSPTKTILNFYPFSKPAGYLSRKKLLTHYGSFAKMFLIVN